MPSGFNVQILPGRWDPPLAGEIATYLGDNGGRADPGNLYIVWIGAHHLQAGLAPQETLAAK
jgi:hypothetical protein